MYDRHGIIQVVPYPILRPSQLRLNIVLREKNIAEINDFMFWGELLSSTLDRYDAALLQMSDRIMAYKRKLVTDTAKKLGIEWGKNDNLDDILFAIHDKNTANAIHIHQRIAAMEEELNAIYNFKQNLVQIVNEMLVYQHYFYAEQNIEMMQLIKELHEARRDAHFWKGMYSHSSECEALWMKRAFDLLTKQKA